MPNSIAQKNAYNITASDMPKMEWHGTVMGGQEFRINRGGDVGFVTFGQIECIRGDVYASIRPVRFCDGSSDKRFEKHQKFRRGDGAMSAAKQWIEDALANTDA